MMVFAAIARYRFECASLSGSAYPKWTWTVSCLLARIDSDNGMPSFEFTNREMPSARFPCPVHLVGFVNWQRSAMSFITFEK